MVEVFVRDVKLKSDNDGKGTVKVVFVSPENSEFTMVLHLSALSNTSINSKMFVVIESIKPGSCKVNISVARDQFVKFSDNEMCTVTEISGRSIYGKLVSGETGIVIYNSSLELEVGSTFLCKVKRRGRLLHFIPHNYNTTSDTLEKSTLDSWLMFWVLK